MIGSSDLYQVMAATVPLYAAMTIAYGSVKWWKIFTAEQCSGINRFVALFAVPLLSFHFISSNNPFTMNVNFIAADSLQKLIVLGVLALWSRLRRRRSLEWTITLFSLSTLPNTLVMGIPLLRGMYGDSSGSLMVQIVVLQCIIWYTLMLFMLEYRGAIILISEQFPETAGSIDSIHVDSDVVSLDGGDQIEAEAEVKEDGKLRVTVRRSNASRSEEMRSQRLSSTTPRPSNLTNAEIYSLQSSRNPTPRGSSVNPADLCSTVTPRLSNFGCSASGEHRLSLRPSNYDEDSASRASRMHHPAPNDSAFPPRTVSGGAGKKSSGIGHAMGDEIRRDLHLFVWSSSASPLSGVFGSNELAARNQKDIPTSISPGKEDSKEENESNFLHKRGDGMVEKMEEGKNRAMPPTSVMTRLILIMVWRKLIRNPNSYSSLVGLTWSLISFRWNIAIPAIISNSISILSDAGLGMAMFSLGLFMALQPKIIACGNSMAAFAMAMRFLTGPAVMAAASIAVGLRGTLLHVAIVQAALPQGIVPFVFAKEYSVHPDILSTTVIFGMLVALPIALVYYILLDL